MNFAHFGGRKQFNGYLYSVLVTGMAVVLDATFEQYALWLAVALLGTTAAVMYEDIKRKS